MYFNTWIFNIHSSEDTFHKHFEKLADAEVKDGLVFTSGCTDIK